MLRGKRASRFLFGTEHDPQCAAYSGKDFSMLTQPLSCG